jgi:hypothetical protein
MQVPTATSLKDIYPADALTVQKKRWENLLQTFKSEYGQQADFVSRSPGRVNLIGEVSYLFTILMSVASVSNIRFGEGWELLLRYLFITITLRFSTRV